MRCGHHDPVERGCVISSPIGVADPDLIATLLDPVHHRTVSNALVQGARQGMREFVHAAADAAPCRLKQRLAHQTAQALRPAGLRCALRVAVAAQDLPHALRTQPARFLAPTRARRRVLDEPAPVGIHRLQRQSEMAGPVVRMQVVVRNPKRAGVGPQPITEGLTQREDASARALTGFEQHDLVTEPTQQMRGCEPGYARAHNGDAMPAHRGRPLR
jgi:hypothetical protein